MDRKQIVFLFALFSIIVASLFYTRFKKAEINADRITQVNKHPGFVKGIIYKNAVNRKDEWWVRYILGKVHYSCNLLWINDVRNLHEGDSLSLKYCMKNPKLIITELEKEY